MDREAWRATFHGSAEESVTKQQQQAEFFSSNNYLKY